MQIVLLFKLDARNATVPPCPKNQLGTKLDPRRVGTTLVKAISAREIPEIGGQRLKATYLDAKGTFIAQIGSRQLY